METKTTEEWVEKGIEDLVFTFNLFSKFILDFVFWMQFKILSYYF